MPNPSRIGTKLLELAREEIGFAIKSRVPGTYLGHLRAASKLLELVQREYEEETSDDWKPTLDV